MLPKIAFSRKLRNEATVPERKLWRAIREAWPELNWRKQVPIGPRYADFVLHAEKLIVEVDGETHADGAEYDVARAAFLTSVGYRVLRFWANEVMQNVSGVLETIALNLPAAHPHPIPPLKGQGVREC